MLHFEIESTIIHYIIHRNIKEKGCIRLGLANLHFKDQTQPRRKFNPSQIYSLPFFPKTPSNIVKVCALNSSSAPIKLFFSHLLCRPSPTMWPDTYCKDDQATDIHCLIRGVLLAPCWEYTYWKTPHKSRHLRSSYTVM